MAYGICGHTRCLRGTFTCPTELELVYPALVFGTRRLRNEQTQELELPPPVELPHREAASLAMSMLWAYAEAENKWADMRPILREYATADPDDWYAATEWLSEENLVERLDWDPEGFELAQVTPLGWSMLRWWGWEDVARASNPSQIQPGDFIVIREPITRRYHVLACEDRGCLKLVGPQGGASSPSSAAMWARRVGGTDARVWLIETRQMHFPIARTANAMAFKDRLRAV